MSLNGDAMTNDMKEKIAKAARKLLVEKSNKKLTVTDIVEECQITRQAFYYHFEDIPELFRWALEKDTQRMLQEAHAQKDPEQGLLYFFKVAVQAGPYIKKGMQSKYKDEIERLLIQNAYVFFEQIVEAENLYQNCTHSELKFILRYHSHAVISLIQDWTDEDTKNIEQIVHMLYLLMVGKLSPLS